MRGLFHRRSYLPPIYDLIPRRSPPLFPKPPPHLTVSHRWYKSPRSSQIGEFRFGPGSVLTDKSATIFQLQQAQPGLVTNPTGLLFCDTSGRFKTQWLFTLAAVIRLYDPAFQLVPWDTQLEPQRTSLLQGPHVRRPSMHALMMAATGLSGEEPAHKDNKANKVKGKGKTTKESRRQQQQQQRSSSGSDSQLGKAHRHRTRGPHNSSSDDMSSEPEPRSETQSESEEGRDTNWKPAAVDLVAAVAEPPAISVPLAVPVLEDAAACSGNDSRYQCDVWMDF